MEVDVRDKLIDLNRRFYQSFAKQFSDTRQRLQPGVMRILELISTRDDVLDLVCGNGAACALRRNRNRLGFELGNVFCEINGILFIEEFAEPINCYFLSSRF